MAYTAPVTLDCSQLILFPSLPNHFLFICQQHSITPRLVVERMPSLHRGMLFVPLSVIYLNYSHLPIEFAPQFSTQIYFYIAFSALLVAPHFHHFSIIYPPFYCYLFLNILSFIFPYLWCLSISLFWIKEFVLVLPVILVIMQNCCLPKKCLVNLLRSEFFTNFFARKLMFQALIFSRTIHHMNYASPSNGLQIFFFYFSVKLSFQLKILRLYCNFIKTFHNNTNQIMPNNLSRGKENIFISLFHVKLFTLEICTENKSNLMI